MIVGEVTGTCTQRTAAIGAQASKEGLMAITSGRAIAQQGLATTCVDPLTEGDQRWWEDGGLAREPV